jgi:putative tryptophan/tyrosine transport system substrate-binding protein
MRRRDLITLLGGAATSSIACSLGVHAQQTALPVVGFLSAIPPNNSFLAAFRRGLAESGYVDGQNVKVEYRFAERYDQLTGLASDLARSQVAVLVAAGGEPSAVAAKALTATIPIVFTGVDDPVSSGLVASLSHPGSNITGMSTLTATLGSKRLQLLHEMVPHAVVIAMLMNPNFPAAAAELSDVEGAANALGHELLVLKAATETDIDTAFDAFVGHRPDALVIGADPFFNTRRAQILALASRNSIPTIYVWREFVRVGGLMSYGTDFADNYRKTGAYVGRILRGEKVADLPVQQPTKFELVINLNTAKSLALDVPSTLLATADEVIE